VANPINDSDAIVVGYLLTLAALVTGADIY
jgi:hypothetical protein